MQNKISEAIENLNKQYDAFFIDENIAGANDFASQNERVILYGPNHFNCFELAKNILPKMMHNKTMYIHGKIFGNISVETEFATKRQKNLKQADFILAFCDKPDNQILQTNKEIYLIADENDSYENSLAKQHLANGNHVEFFGKPWPLVYEYLFKKFGTHNILAIENTQSGIKGAQLNNIDYLEIK